TWPDNPLGRPLTGSSTTVRSFKRSDMVAFRDNNYHPANMSVIAAGKIASDRFFDCVSKKFTGRKKKKTPTFRSPVVDQNRPRAKFMNSNTKQTHVALGFPLLVKDARERFSLKLMNVILGGNMSSRLFEELREKHGLCYEISSSYKRHSDLSELVIHSGVDSSRVLKSIVSILDELKKIRDYGVTEEELLRAKEYAKGQFLLAMEGTATRMLWLGDRLMVHRDIPEVREVIKRVDEVEAGDIKKACEKAFRAALANLAVIGNLKKNEIKDIRRELGKL
ncbi:MAG: pitrilysin family protein, partial [Candidatus Omnitrophota bacterium]